MRRVAIPVLLLSSVVGCCVLEPADVVKPSTVTLEDALASVGRGLREMRKELAEVKTGLLTDEVEITLSLAVSADARSKLGVNLETADLEAAQVELGASGESVTTATRSNVIRIRFKNLLSLPSGTLATSTSPQDVKALLDMAKDAEILRENPHVRP